MITAMGSGVSKVIMILGTFYCTNTLTKLEFGEYSFVRNTLTMVITICASNFSGLCTKFAAEARTSLNSQKRLLLLFLFSLTVCVISGLIFVVLPQSTLISLLGTQESIAFFRFAGLLLPLFMVQPLIEGTLRGRMHFKVISWLQVISSLFYVITLVVGLHLAGVNGAVWGLYLYYALYAIVSMACIFRVERPIQVLGSLGGFWIEYHSIFKMVLPVFILSFIEAPIFWYLQVLMTRYSSAEAVGSMTVMKQVRNLALLVPNYFFTTYIAFAGKMNAERQHVAYFSQFDRLIKWFCLAGIGMAIVISLLSQPTLFLFGREYIQDWPVLVICCLGIPISLMMSLIKQSLILQEHQRELMFISILWNILWIALFYFMVHLGINSLSAFFYSEITAWLVNLGVSYWMYNNDKKKLTII
jgi:O-antigen/teichoic acid export membrane protein